MSEREGIFVQGLWVERESQQPKVPEVGATSAPLESMAFFFASFCEPWSKEFMKCRSRTFNSQECLPEGRKVTRCGLDLIQKLKDNCDVEWTDHWTCLDYHNHSLYKCRNQEKILNDCVFKKLGIKKVIPDVPLDEQIHEKVSPLFKPRSLE